MPLVCLVCTMRAMLANEPQPYFEEAADAHMIRAHPQGVTPAEKQDLTRRCVDLITARNAE